MIMNFSRINIIQILKMMIKKDMYLIVAWLN